MKMEGTKEFYTRKDWYSPSSLVTTSRCLRLHFYTSGCKLRPVKEPHCSLTFGTAIHSALPVALANGPQVGIEEFKKTWGDTEGDDKRNLERAEDMICDFCLKSKPYEVMKAPETKLKGGAGDYEIPFAIDIGLERPLAGKLDGWCKHRVTQEIWGLEYKTTSGLGSFFFDAFKRSPQITAYALALREITQERLTGVFLEGLLVAKIKVNNLTQPLTLIDSEMEVFLAWAKEQEDRIHRCEDRHDWPQNFGTCNGYNYYWRPTGNCPYMDLCQSSDWRDLLELYEVNEHVPLWIE